MAEKEKKEYRKYPYFEKWRKGVYYAFVRIHNVKRRISLRTRNERVAAERFTVLCQNLDHGIVNFEKPRSRVAFVDIAREYLEEGTEDLAPKSIMRHQQSIFGLRKDGKGKGYLAHYFGHRSITSIRPKDIARYIRWRQKMGAAPNTIVKELAALSAVFNYSVLEEIVPFNYVRAVKKPKIKQVRPNYCPNREEIERILSNLYPGAFRMFLVMVNTGTRIGEIRHCNVQDADLKNRLLHVVGKGDKERPVAMNDVVVLCITEELRGRRAKPDDPLFLNREGKRYRSLRTPLETACKKAGVPHIGHHSLRHAYATLILEEKKGELIHVSKILGHANPTVTQNIYVRPFDESLRRVAEAFEIKPTEKVSKKGQIVKMKGGKTA